MTENGIREAIQNLKDTVKNLADRIHSLEITGCPFRQSHEDHYREFWQVYNENKKEVEKKMEKQRLDIQDLKMSGTKIGVYVGIIVAVIGMLAQALIQIVL